MAEPVLEITLTALSPRSLQTTITLHGQELGERAPAAAPTPRMDVQAKSRQRAASGGAVEAIWTGVQVVPAGPCKVAIFIPPGDGRQALPTALRGKEAVPDAEAGATAAVQPTPPTPQSSLTSLREAVSLSVRAAHAPFLLSAVAVSASAVLTMVAWRARRGAN